MFSAWSLGYFLGNTQKHVRSQTKYYILKKRLYFERRVFTVLQEWQSMHGERRPFFLFNFSESDAVILLILLKYTIDSRGMNGCCQ